MSPNSSPRSDGGYWTLSPRRLKAETATSNSCLGPRVTERLNIVRLGHRGDGIADTSEGPVYVPYTLPGETVTVEPVTGHPDRRHLVHVD
ncbi:MAG: TRAM domain-containing protein, partial [Pseudolabrys sp.]